MSVPPPPTTSVPAFTSTLPLLANAIPPLIDVRPHRAHDQRARFVTDAVPVKKSSGVAKLLASSIVPPTAFVRLFAPPPVNPKNTLVARNRQRPLVHPRLPPTSARNPLPDGVLTVLAPSVVNVPGPLNDLPLAVTANEPLTVTAAVPPSVPPTAPHSAARPLRS